LPITDFDKYYSTDFNDIVFENFYKKNPHLSGSLSLGYNLDEKHKIFLESEFIKSREFYIRDVVQKKEFKQWDITGIPVTMGYQYKFLSFGQLDLFVESGLSYIFSDINSEMTKMYYHYYSDDHGLDPLQTIPEAIEIIKDSGFGGHVGAGINMDISNKMFTFFRARYRYAPVMTIMSGYDDEVDFDFTGYYFNLGLGYTF
ncbi:outer membrane beta-barrel protein, partial [candidate division KSB1 bacterium]